MTPPSCSGPQLICRPLSADADFTLLCAWHHAFTCLSGSEQWFGKGNTTGTAGIAGVTEDWDFMGRTDKATKI